MKKVLISLLMAGVLIGVSSLSAGEPGAAARRRGRAVPQISSKLEGFYTTLMSPPRDPRYEMLYTKVLVRLYNGLSWDDQVRAKATVEIQPFPPRGVPPATDAEMMEYERMEKSGIYSGMGL